MEGRLEIKELQKTIHACSELQYLSKLKIKREGWLKIPKWIYHESGQSIEVATHDSDDLLPESVLSKKLSLESGKTLAFDIINRSNGNSSLVMSWHHLLMDGQGALFLIRRIAENREGEYLVAEEPKPVQYSFRLRMKTIKLFLWYTALFWAPLAHKFRANVRPVKRPKDFKYKAEIINIDKEEYRRLNKNATLLGAPVGLSTFYLSCTAMAVKDMLNQKGKSVRAFWVPIPQDQRRKGSHGPILGNQLSFLFYKMNGRNLNSLPELMTSLQEQWLQQVKHLGPQAYDALMRGFRRLPSGLYYHLVKGSRGSNLASFLMTFAAQHPSGFKSFKGHRIINAFSLPPNTYPPGFTVVMQPKVDEMQIALLYYSDVWTADEMTDLIAKLKTYLLHAAIA